MHVVLKHILVKIPS